MRRTAPLFRLDAGWLFVAAGLAVCAAGMILPAQGDLRTLQQQLDTLRHEEARAYARLKAYNDFLEELDEENPALVRRLAASQLNIVPASDRPVLLSTAQIVPVTNWIEATVSYEPPAPRLMPDSTLSKLANGPMRLWLLAGGIMCVFVGLLLGSTSVRRPRNETPADAMDEARMPLAEAQVEAALVADSTSDAATANEHATLQIAQTATAIDELARDIAGEVEAEAARGDEAEPAIADEDAEACAADLEAEDSVDEVSDESDEGEDAEDNPDDESDDGYVMEHAGSEDEDGEEEDGDDDEAEDVPERSR